MNKETEFDLRAQIAALTVKVAEGERAIETLKSFRDPGGLAAAMCRFADSLKSLPVHPSLNSFDFSESMPQANWEQGGPAILPPYAYAPPPSVPGEVGLPELFDYVQAMIRDNVKHKTKGFGLGEMPFVAQVDHLKEEARELGDATNWEAIHDETADVLGVLVHIAAFSRQSPEQLIKRCLIKLQLRFDHPAAAALANQPGVK